MKLKETFRRREFLKKAVQAATVVVSIGAAHASGAAEQSVVWSMRCPDWSGAKQVIDDTKLVGEEQPKREAQKS